MWWLRLAYDGTDFHGVNPSRGLRTVAGEIEGALMRLGFFQPCARLLSRTDAGVHADDAVAYFEGGDGRDAQVLLMALSHHLPPDLRPSALASALTAPVSVAKTYRYTLDTSALGDVRLYRRAWRVRLSGQHLDACAAALVGENDFEAFRRRGETRANLRRKVIACDWTRAPGRLDFTITGTGFPLHGVRALVGGMVHVDQGHARVEDFVAALHGKCHPVARQGAPATGLCLIKTKLDPEPMWIGCRA